MIFPPLDRIITLEELVDHYGEPDYGAGRHTGIELKYFKDSEWETVCAYVRKSDGKLNAVRFLRSDPTVVNSRDVVSRDLAPAVYHYDHEKGEVKFYMYIGGNQISLLYFVDHLRRQGEEEKAKELLLHI